MHQGTPSEASHVVAFSSCLYRLWVVPYAGWDPPGATAPSQETGGVGDRHLVNPKIFVAAHCVVV